MSNHIEAYLRGRFLGRNLTQGEANKGCIRNHKPWCPSIESKEGTDDSKRSSSFIKTQTGSSMLRGEEVGQTEEEESERQEEEDQENGDIGAQCCNEKQ